MRCAKQHLEDHIFTTAVKVRAYRTWENNLTRYHEYFDIPEDISLQELSSHWLKYLFDMALEYCVKESPVLKAIYTAERFRYFLSMLDYTTKQRFYDEIILVDCEAIIKEVPVEVRAQVRIKLESLHQAVLVEKTKAFKIKMVGDCIFHEVLMYLEQQCASSGIELSVSHTYFGAYRDGAFDNAALLNVKEEVGNDIDAVAVSFFTYWGIPDFRALLLESAVGNMDAREIKQAIGVMLAQVKSFVAGIRSISSVPIFLHNASGIPWLLGRSALSYEPWNLAIEGEIPAAWEIIIGELNFLIQVVAEEYENIILVDERQVVADLGRWGARTSLLPPHLWQGALFHPFALGYKIAETYHSCVEFYLSVKKCKAILIDFDETLWSGVMAEGSVSHYTGRQDLLRQLVDRGILLVALSKNSLNNIRWAEMKIPFSHFVKVCLQWENKVEVVGQIAEELNLDPASFVYVDDCERQRELVSINYPEVVILDSKDESTWNCLAFLMKMENTSTTGDAFSRTAKYQQNVQRRRAKEEFFDPTVSLRQLDIRVTMSKAVEQDFERIEELLRRTNQFNCTGVLYRKADLRQLNASSIWDIWKFDMADKFGDMGCVGVIVVNKKLASKSVIFEALVMSCRAMGYGVENYMVASVVGAYPQWSYVGIFRSTNKNGPSADLYQSLGFQKREDSLWVLEDGDVLPQAPDWINIKGHEVM